MIPYNDTTEVTTDSIRLWEMLFQLSGTGHRVATARTLHNAPQGLGQAVTSHVRRAPGPKANLDELTPALPRISVVILVISVFPCQIGNVWIYLPFYNFSSQVGMGWSGALGTGLVVARRADGSWSAPSSLSLWGLGWGIQFGGALHDLLLVLKTR